MTEAGWTREKPTKNGWYWWRFDASMSATIVRIMVCGDGSLAEMSHNGHLLLAANFGGEFLGPLSPTDRQQGRVAGLRQAGEAYIKYLMNREYRKSWKTFDEWCRWMAQQAQEGEGVGDVHG